MKALEEKIAALKQTNESLLITVKQQEDRITEITTDSSHWERKSVSLSKELGEGISIRSDYCYCTLYVQQLINLKHTETIKCKLLCILYGS